MSLAELLAQLGLAWPRLVLYPGGLAAFALAWLIGLLPRYRRNSLLPYRRNSLRLYAIIAPWLGLALLPLPGAAQLDWVPDVVMVLTLLEAPLLLLLADELHSPHLATRQHGAVRLAVLRTGYPPFLLGLLLLAFSSGSLRLDLLTNAPDANLATMVLHWLGATAIVLALPALLATAVTENPQGSDPALNEFMPSLAHRWGLRLRAVGLWALVSLPWLAPLGQSPWLLPLPPLLIGLLLLGVTHHVQRLARRLGWVYLALDGVLLLALLAGALLRLVS